MLEKEFALKEIEIDKQLRSQDARLQQILDELKKRCKGYLGQLYELIKPINKKYDIAVKVSLSKQLRYLVVDTVQSSRYCTEFLKEKGIQKDVLVLENIPRVHRQKKNQISGQKLQSYEADFIKDVINISRKANGKVE